MKNKILLAIAAFILVCINFTSCMSSDTTEYSADARITSFGLDSINGKYYKFEIDQLERLIFNRDSMPYMADTVLDSITIDTLTYQSYVLAGELDTVLNTSNQQDLRDAINKSGQGGIKLTSIAADGTTKMVYHLQIRVHQQDPDSVIWAKKEAFTSTPLNTTLKAITLNEKLLLYTSATTAYTTSTVAASYGWSIQAVTGLPADIDYTSVIKYNGTLFMNTSAGDIYTSTDGLAWTKNADLSGSITTLIGYVEKSTTYDNPAVLCAIREVNGTKHFCYTADMTTWTIGAEVPEKFPTKNISSVHQTTVNGFSKTIIVGMPNKFASYTSPWYTMDGATWSDMYPAKNGCPIIENPFITYYADNFYMFGGPFEAVYTSINALGWTEMTKGYLLPESFLGLPSYTIAEEENHAIWVIFGGDNTGNAVWRGRMNKTSFIKQK